MYSVVNQVFDVSITRQEPQQLVNDSLQEDTLGGKQGKTLTQIETHLVSEDTARTCACAVTLDHTILHYSFKKVVILFHNQNVLSEMLPASSIAA